MKRYSIEAVRKWKVSRAGTPAPFPGKEPLRMAMVIHFKWGPPLRYVGKFNWRAVDNVVREAGRRPVTSSWSAVFDRKHLVSVNDRRYLPGERLYGAAPYVSQTAHNSLLKRYYTPFDSDFSHLEVALPYKFQVEGHRGYASYMPTPDDLAAHKTWLETNKFVKRTEETKADVAPAIAFRYMMANNTMTAPQQVNWFAEEEGLG